MDAKEILKEMCRIYDEMEEDHSLMWQEYTLTGDTCGDEYGLIAEDHYLDGYWAALHDLMNLMGIREG